MKLLFTLIFFGLFPACCGLKQDTSSTAKVESPQQTKLLPIFKLSAYAKSFIHDLNDELAMQKVGIDNYKPSDALIERYLTKSHKRYLIHGVIKVDDHFDAIKLDALEIAAGRQLSKIMTVSIPLKKIQKFINLKHVEYFEMNPKSHL